MGEKGNNGGRRKGAGRKKGSPNNGRGGKSPKEFMNALVPVEVVEPEAVEAERVDFDFTKKEYIDPVQFCLAVINYDREVLEKLNIIEIPDLGTRIEAARVAIRFTNKPKPLETVSKHEFSWHDKISEAENRLNTLRKEKKNDFHTEPVN